MIIKLSVYLFTIQFGEYNAVKVLNIINIDKCLLAFSKVFHAPHQTRFSNLQIPLKNAGARSARSVIILDRGSMREATVLLRAF